jgi:hypothetical protein
MIDWITSYLPPWFLIGIIAFAVILGSVAYLILLERKVASWVQDRLGPNRVGLGFGIVPWLKDKPMFGLGQPMAEVLLQGRLQTKKCRQDFVHGCAGFDDDRDDRQCRRHPLGRVAGDFADISALSGQLS